MFCVKILTHFLLFENLHNSGYPKLSAKVSLSGTPSAERNPKRVRSWHKTKGLHGRKEKIEKPLTFDGHCASTLPFKRDVLKVAIYMLWCHNVLHVQKSYINIVKTLPLCMNFFF